MTGSKTSTTIITAAYQADWLLSAAGPLKDRVIELCGDMVSFIGTYADYQTKPAAERAEITRLDQSIIFPGLINCHVHTNFPSGLKLDFSPGSMVSWIRSALAARAARSEAGQTADVRHALDRLEQTATAAIGEISNDFVSLEPIISSGIVCRYFCERLGFTSDLADEALLTLADEIRQRRKFALSALESAFLSTETVTLHTAPHAPYSSHENLIRELAGGPDFSSIHVAEGPEEVELLKTGKGAWRGRLREIGRDNPAWTAPGLSPVAYLDSIGALSANTLVVHAVQVSDDDIALLAERSAPVIVCPLSNTLLGVGVSPLGKFLEAGITVGLGTDSLASNRDLNLFAEMRELRRLHNDIPPGALWNIATKGGAGTLGYSALGELIVGNSPGVFASQVKGIVDSASPEELIEALIAEGDRKLTRLARASL